MQLRDLANSLVHEAESQIAAVRAEGDQALEGERRQRAQVEKQLKESEALLKDHEKQFKEHEKQSKDHEKQLKDIEKQLKEQSAAQAFADAARREAEAAREKEAAAREQEVAARAAVERELAAARERADERERAVQQAESAHAEQLRSEKARLMKSALQPLDHLRTAFDRYRGVTTIGDVLSILLESMATEFARVAVFDVDAHRLEVTRHAGFDGHDMSKVVVPLATQSPLTKAVKDGKVQGLTARDLTDTTRALVGGSPNFVLVLPVPIRGQVRAVVYADDSGQTVGEVPSPERRVRFAEILLWHTVPLLTRLALEEEAIAEFREYAASIVNDLESVYIADAAKHKSAELRKRLQLNLQYARRRFNERMQAEGPTAAKLLDEQLAAAIEQKSDTPFGKDLAAVSS